VALILLGVGLVIVGRSESYVAIRDASDVWKPFSTSALESLRGQNVLVDVTADWCLTCQVNDRLVFSDASVMKLLAEKKITLVRADWTQRNPEITRYLNRFSRVGVPFYVLYSAQHPNGVPLPELLTRAGFVERIRAEYP
jgi:thiol:disulfide interchange protein